MDSPRTESTTVAEILSRANLIESAKELEQLTSSLLALKTKKLAPVASSDETRLLLVINGGVPVGVTDRVESLVVCHSLAVIVPHMRPPAPDQMGSIP